MTEQELQLRAEALIAQANVTAAIRSVDAVELIASYRVDFDRRLQLVRDEQRAGLDPVIDEREALDQLAVGDKAVELLEGD